MGLKAPTSVQEAIHNTRHNTSLLLKITAIAVIGITGIATSLICNNCMLCYSSDSSDFNEKSSSTIAHPSSVYLYCLPGLLSSFTMYVGILKLLKNNYKMSTRTHQSSHILKKSSWITGKNITLILFTLFGLSSNLFCMLAQINLSGSKQSQSIGCKVTEMFGIIAGCGYCLHALQIFLFSMLTPSYPQSPLYIEMLPVTSLINSAPTTQSHLKVLYLLCQIDISITQLLTSSINQLSNNAADLSLLQIAQTNIKELSEAFQLSSYNLSFIQEIAFMQNILLKVTLPLSHSNNLIQLAKILGHAHSLTSKLVSLGALESSLTTNIALPSLQALCPPPVYSLEEEPLLRDCSHNIITTSFLLESPPLYSLPTSNGFSEETPQNEQHSSIPNHY
ncbi:hypothetical protein [Candidatus Clavichlamydia salmonicola]|uniref:hypothetical protein n=1 Tax=Candidatus Clavichlamydia salmonicola TaxID=469812 RepID=UPI001891B398|nr:hypothetical protein [Candidatus Clavichlamydia salmonicola]